MNTILMFFLAVNSFTSILVLSSFKLFLKYLNYDVAKTSGLSFAGSISAIKCVFSDFINRTRPPFLGELFSHEIGWMVLAQNMAAITLFLMSKFKNFYVLFFLVFLIVVSEMIYDLAFARRTVESNNKNKSMDIFLGHKIAAALPIFAIGFLSEPWKFGYSNTLFFYSILAFLGNIPLILVDINSKHLNWQGVKSFFQKHKLKILFVIFFCLLTIIINNNNYCLGLLTGLQHLLQSPFVQSWFFVFLNFVLVFCAFFSFFIPSGLSRAFFCIFFIIQSFLVSFLQKTATVFFPESFFSFFLLLISIFLVFRIEKKENSWFQSPATIPFKCLIFFLSFFFIKINSINIFEKVYIILFPVFFTFLILEKLFRVLRNINFSWKKLHPAKILLFLSPVFYMLFESFFLKKSFSLDMKLIFSLLFMLERSFDLLYREEESATDWFFAQTKGYWPVITLIFFFKAPKLFFHGYRDHVVSDVCNNIVIMQSKFLSSIAGILGGILANHIGMHKLKTKNLMYIGAFLNICDLITNFAANFATHNLIVLNLGPYTLSHNALFNICMFIEHFFNGFSMFILSRCLARISSKNKTFLFTLLWGVFALSRSLWGGVSGFVLKNFGHENLILSILTVLPFVLLFFVNFEKYEIEESKQHQNQIKRS